MRQRQIQLPRTDTRPRAISFLRLLYYLAPNPSTGFDFKGTTHKPGAWIEEKDLWPTPHYPLTPVALEMTEARYVDHKAKGHRKIPMLFVVWIYADGEWRDIARYTGHGLAWVQHIAPVVRKLLDEQTPIRPAVDFSPVMRRIVAVVAGELNQLNRQEDRVELLECVCEYFAGESAHQKSGVQLPLDWERYFSQ